MGLYWRTRHRLGNRWMDTRAFLAGYCNDCPWNADPGQGGGYSFWRCGWKRRHDGLHRSRNYVWTDDGRTSYVPVNFLAEEWADQPWDRHPTTTLRTERARRRWHEAREAERRASR